MSPATEESGAKLHKITGIVPVHFNSRVTADSRYTYEVEVVGHDEEDVQIRADFVELTEGGLPFNEGTIVTNDDEETIFYAFEANKIYTSEDDTRYFLLSATQGGEVFLRKCDDFKIRMPLHARAARGVRNGYLRVHNWFFPG